MLKKKFDWKELGIDLLVDLAAGMLGAVGIYNFALNANFPVAGFSGIAIILYHLFKIPVGAGMILLNIPVTIFCYKYLGKTFFLKSVKTTLIWSVLTDYVAPMLPVYNGNRLLAALCMGVLCGIGCADFYARFLYRRTGFYQYVHQESKTTHDTRYDHIRFGYLYDYPWKCTGIQRS